MPYVAESGQRSATAPTRVFAAIARAHRDTPDCFVPVGAGVVGVCISPRAPF